MFTAWDLQIEVIFSKISASICHLNYQFLASDWSGSECYLITGTTP
jgi:hypothetical protein